MSHHGLLQRHQDVFLNRTSKNTTTKQAPEIQTHQLESLPCLNSIGVIVSENNDGLWDQGARAISFFKVCGFFEGKAHDSAITLNFIMVYQ